MIDAMYRSLSVRTLALLAICISPAATSAEEEIAVLTVRRDNIRKSTKSELVPIARIERGQFQPIAGVENPENSVCAPKTFSGWAQLGVAYEVLYRGGVIGSTITRKHDRGTYSCSELCVVGTATTFKKKAPGLKSQRKGFDPSGFFDEAITQYVAYASTEGKRPFSSVAVPLTKAERSAVLAYARERIVGATTKVPTRTVITQFEPFISSKAGEVHVFVSAEMKRPKGALRVISAVVKRGDKGKFESLLELIKDGEEDRGAASYELIDAVDFDGDGIAELLVVYHDYEFHEFRILRRGSARYEIVHKGPSYGC